MFSLIGIFIFTISGCVDSRETIIEPASNKVTSTQREQNFALNTEALSSVITLSAEQALTYQNLELRVLAVEDSRCPIGVSCIWAGQLVVILEVSNQRNETIEVKLIRKREPKTAKVFDYELLLLSVEPHPQKDKVIQLSDQVIELKIVKVR